MIERGIDHVVLAVRDLAGARAQFQRLGFTTTPRADHPFGTCNSLVQLRDSFIELLAVADPSKIGPGDPLRFSFGAFNAGFLRRREGMSMLAFASTDARRDLQEFRGAGLQTFGPVDFSRLATLPDGRRATVAFSLAFVTDPRLHEAAFFVCQQRAQEHFWMSEYQRHRLGAKRIAEVVLVAEQAPAFADLFGKLQRPGQVRIDGEALHVATARGAVTVLSPERFLLRYPGVRPLSDGAYFGAVRLAVRDVSAAEGSLQSEHVPHRREAGRLWLEPEQAHGVVLELSD